MSYDPRAIANYFLQRAWVEGKSLSPMQVQKLVYFAHGWHLAIEGEPLIDEQVEAWPYGPVIPSLYRAFRSYGNQPIEALSGDMSAHFPPGADADDPEFRFRSPEVDEKSDVAHLLDRIWEIYGGYTAIQLSNMTHQSDSPWSQVYREYRGAIPKGTDIPAGSIREYFRGLSGD